MLLKDRLNRANSSLVAIGIDTLRFPVSTFSMALISWFKGFKIIFATIIENMIQKIRHSITITKYTFLIAYHAG